MDSLITRHNMQTIAEENARFMKHVYKWMVVALTITTATIYYLANTPIILAPILKNPFFFWGLIALHLITVVYFSTLCIRTNSFNAFIYLILYSILMGITVAAIALFHHALAIYTAFFAIAICYCILVIFSAITNKDLGGIATLFFMLITAIPLFYLSRQVIFHQADCDTLCYVVICIVSVLTAGNISKIKRINLDEDLSKTAVHGALMLYLDHINLLLFPIYLANRKKK